MLSYEEYLSVYACNHPHLTLDEVKEAVDKMNVCTPIVRHAEVMLASDGRRGSGPADNSVDLNEE